MMVVFDPFSSFDSKIYFKFFCFDSSLDLQKTDTLLFESFNQIKSLSSKGCLLHFRTNSNIRASFKFPYLPYFAIHYVSAFSPPFICWLTELIHIIGHLLLFFFFFWLAFSSSRKSAQINILASEHFSDNQHEILHPWLFFSSFVKKQASLSRRILAPENRTCFILSSAANSGPSKVLWM